VDARTGPLEFWDAILRRIYAATDVETLARTVVAEAPKLIGSVHASFNAMAPSVPWAQIWMDRGDDPERLQRSFAAHMHEHPAVRNFLRTGDPTTHAISDFASARVFQATQLYQQLYRELGVRDQMGFCLGPPGRENFALALGRERRSFTATDRRWMERLRPHVGQALDNARAFERLNRRLQGAVEGASALGHALVVLDQALRPVVYPTAAERLLQRFLPRPWGSEAALPGDLLRWLRVSLAASAPARWRVPEGSGASRSPWILTRGGERLVVRARFDPETQETTLLLERRTAPDATGHLRAQGLTAREVEVVLALEQGKRNAEIAAALGISPQTVRKHLENIFAKLGVHTRTAAVAALHADPEPEA